MASSHQQQHPPHTNHREHDRALPLDMLDEEVGLLSIPSSLSSSSTSSSAAAAKSSSSQSSTPSFTRPVLTRVSSYSSGPSRNTPSSSSHHRTPSSSSTPRSLSLSLATTAAQQQQSTNGSASGGGGGRRNFFGFLRGKRGTSGTNLTDPTALSSPSTTTVVPPPRRKWWRYPVRVPILSLLLVSLLARSSEGYLSIAGFLCGFLLFEGFSAPDTGQPNRIETVMRSLIAKCKKYKKEKGKKKLQRKIKDLSAAAASATSSSASSSHSRRNPIHTLVLCFRCPSFLQCCFRSRYRNQSSSSTIVEEKRSLLTGSRDDVGGEIRQARDADEDERNDGVRANHRENGDTESIVAPAPPPVEDTDVLLDVAVSVTEDPGNSPQPAHSPATPLHPMRELTGESLISTEFDALKETISEALPTVTALTAGDMRVAAAASGVPTSSVVGGRAQWAHFSVSLRFTLMNFHIHLHHWVYLLIICIFLFLEQNYWSEHAASYPIYAFASAFCLGGSVQGLKYADWMNVIWRKRDGATNTNHGAAAGSRSASNGISHQQERASLLSHDSSSSSSSSFNDSRRHLYETKEHDELVLPDISSNSSSSSSRAVQITDAILTHLDESLTDSAPTSEDEHDEHEEEGEQQQQKQPIDLLDDMPPLLPLVRANSIPTINELEIDDTALQTVAI